jgi:hypothetical protein
MAPGAFKEQTQGEGRLNGPKLIYGASGAFLRALRGGGQIGTLK